MLGADVQSELVLLSQAVTHLARDVSEAHRKIAGLEEQLSKLAQWVDTLDRDLKQHRAGIR